MVVFNLWIENNTLSAKEFVLTLTVLLILLFAGFSSYFTFKPDEILQTTLFYFKKSYPTKEIQKIELTLIGVGTTRVNIKADFMDSSGKLRLRFLLLELNEETISILGKAFYNTPNVLNDFPTNGHLPNFKYEPSKEKMALIVREFNLPILE